MCNDLPPGGPIWITDGRPIGTPIVINRNPVTRIVDRALRSALTDAAPVVKLLDGGSAF